MIKLEDLTFSPDNDILEFEVDLKSKTFKVKCEEAYTKDKVLANVELTVYEYESLSISEYDGKLHHEVEFDPNITKLKDICEFIYVPGLLVIKGFSKKMWTEYAIKGGQIQLSA
jgi:hypothetical protein